MKENKLLQKFLNVDMLIAVSCLAVLIVVTLINVISRRFLNHPFTWQEEVQLWLIVWAVCYGGSAAFRSGSHVAIEMLVELLPKKAQRILEYLVYFIAVAVMGYLLYTSCLYVLQLATTNRVSNILKIPTAFIYSALPISLVLMIINLTIYTWFRKEEEVE